MSNKIALKVSKKARDKAKELAGANGKTMSQVIQQAIEKFTQTKQTGTIPTEWLDGELVGLYNDVDSASFSSFRLACYSAGCSARMGFEAGMSSLDRGE